MALLYNLHDVISPVRLPPLKVRVFLMTGYRFSRGFVFLRGRKKGGVCSRDSSCW